MWIQGEAKQGGRRNWSWVGNGPTKILGACPVRARTLTTPQVWCKWAMDSAPHAGAGTLDSKDPPNQYGWHQLETRACPYWKRVFGNGFPGSFPSGGIALPRGVDCVVEWVGGRGCVRVYLQKIHAEVCLKRDGDGDQTS